MGRWFFAASLILFFFAAVGVAFIPNPMAWGLVSLSLGMLIGDWKPWTK